MKKVLQILTLLSFIQHPLSLWAQFGPAEPTSFYIARVKDINPVYSTGGPSWLTDLNGVLYFTAENGVNGRELWKSDGTEAGTVQVKNINLNGSSNPYNFINYSGILFFSADNGSVGRELWKSNGTAAGTELVKNINPSGDSDPSGPVVMNNVLYFFADNGTDGRELWRSNGTSAGTYQVKDINPAGDGVTLFGEWAGLNVMNGVLYFVAQDASGPGLWRSDGTTAGTYQIHSLSALTIAGVIQALTPQHLTVVGGQLYFFYEYIDSADTFKNRLYKTNGSPGSATHVQTLSGTVHETIAFTSKLFFTTDTGNSDELWFSDGTPSGTQRLKNTNPFGDDRVFQLTTVGNTLFFGGQKGPDNFCLWKTDGTTANTVIVKELYPSNLNAVNGKLFFNGPGSPGLGGPEPWISDGTTSGTRLLKDLNPYGPSVGTTPFVGSGNRVFFAALESDHGVELYKYVPCTFCPVGGREAADLPTETPSSLQLQVQQNPILGKTLTVDVSWDTGQPVQLSLTDLQGRILETRRLSGHQEKQRQVLEVGHLPAGLLLLRASTADQQRVIRLWKP